MFRSAGRRKRVPSGMPPPCTVPSVRVAGGTNTAAVVSGTQKARAWSMWPWITSDGRIIPPSRERPLAATPYGAGKTPGELDAWSIRPPHAACHPSASSRERHSSQTVSWECDQTTIEPSVPLLGRAPAGIGTAASAAASARSPASSWTGTPGVPAGGSYTGAVYWLVLIHGPAAATWRTRSPTSASERRSSGASAASARFHTLSAAKGLLGAAVPGAAAGTPAAPEPETVTGAAATAGGGGGAGTT